jgi:molybdopterin-guanine dinucleotide biosynthesis protein A
MMESLSVAILAGGKSHRFGSPKIKAVLGSHTLLDIMLLKACRISGECMIIAAHHSAGISDNIPVFNDIYQDCGPLGGLYTAMHHSDRPFVAIMPCDMPLLEPQVYQILLEKAVSNRPAVAVSDNGTEPLVSVWPVTQTFPIVGHNLRLKKFSMHVTLRELEAVQVSIKSCISGYRRDIFRNINFQEDLRQLEYNQQVDNVPDRE